MSGAIMRRASLAAALLALAAPAWAQGPQPPPATCEDRLAVLDTTLAQVNQSRLQSEWTMAQTIAALRKQIADLERKAAEAHKPKDAAKP